MIIRDADRNYVTITCDKCQAEAPPAAEILRGHGLIHMGWHCSGGTHICPDCPHPVRPTA